MKVNKQFHLKKNNKKNSIKQYIYNIKKIKII